MTDIVYAEATYPNAKGLNCLSIHWVVNVLEWSEAGSHRWRGLPAVCGLSATGGVGNSRDQVGQIRIGHCQNVFPVRFHFDESHDMPKTLSRFHISDLLSGESTGDQLKRANDGELWLNFVCCIPADYWKIVHLW